MTLFSQRRVGGFTAQELAQELANTAWAFAATGQRDAPLFAALARAAERRLSEFSAQ